MHDVDVPHERVRTVNGQEVRPNGDYVVYWMTAYRRVTGNFALDRAVGWAIRLRKPLVILEALRLDYPWASDRFHSFILQGMQENYAAVRATAATYYAYVERAAGEGKGLLSTLAKGACVVVTDDYPAFFIPRMIETAGRKIDVLLEKVDSNGLLPLDAPGKVFGTAFAFRRYLQSVLRKHLDSPPRENPLASLPPPGQPPDLARLYQRWVPLTEQDFDRIPELVSTLPVNHRVGACLLRGGSEAAASRLHEFLNRKLSRYAEDRNHPDQDATSGLSPYLHFGHLSSHQVLAAVCRHEGWTPDKLAAQATGSRRGWWGMSDGAEAFLDQLVTWRELGFNLCRFVPRYDAYESLPSWALETLEKHAADPRPYVYPLEQLESAASYDPVWNAAQRQLLEEGVIHNYLRMLWGKKILHWTASPRDALEIMIELNNKYGLDGRDPNSYSGIFWILGRYDRPWGPERPIFGKIRYMSSENTIRKIRIEQYLARYR